MKTHEFAQTILYGTTLEEKCVSANLLDLGQWPALKKAPQFPGRPPELARGGKATFPSLARLHEARVRGEVLHFFANHELLAIELMALVLLKFPDAPPSFLGGIICTIGEEQNHLRLYTHRMLELGVRFGDLPVSDYFWKCMSQMRSPLDYIVQMSLTFEQANLDYALFYKNEIEKVGDVQTSLILEQVYREEIGHVKNGVTWFNRLREGAATESDWEAYVRLLPPPLNPSRAKGLEFSAGARRIAGLSEIYIHELEIYSGSKGRPPVLWLYNPCCDLEIARGKPGYTPTAGSQRVTQDLEHLSLYLALENDVILTQRKPRTEWLASIQGAGFTTPEFVLLKESSRRGQVEQSVRVNKIGGMEPWGWSPDSFEEFRPLRSRVVRVSGGNGRWCEKILKQETYEKTGLGRLFSKEWSVEFLQNWMVTRATSLEGELVDGGGEAPFGSLAMKAPFGSLEMVGASYPSWESSELAMRRFFSQGTSVMVKAPYGTAGAQIRHLRKVEELEGKVGGWIRNIIRDQGAVIVEPWLNKVCDLSIQIVVQDEGVQLLEVRRFITGPQHEYRGTYLGRKFAGFAETDLRSIHALISKWRLLITDLGNHLRREGFRGPAGVDALFWRDPQGQLKLKPLVELNPRWTMGRVALELEKNLKPGVHGLWAYLSVREIKKQGYATVESFAQELAQKYPLRLLRVGGGVKRIESGVVFTNDPLRAQEVLTVLAVLPSEDLAGLGRFWPNSDKIYANPLS